MKKLTLEELLGHTFDNYRTVEDAAEHSHGKADFIFHMTDWISDLEALAALYQEPNNLDREAAHQVIFGFLIHALPHLNAAGRLLLDEIGDPFGPSKGDSGKP